MGDYSWPQSSSDFDDQHHFDNAFYHHDGSRAFLSPAPDAAVRGRSPSNTIRRPGMFEEVKWTEAPVPATLGSSSTAHHLVPAFTSMPMPSTSMSAFSPTIECRPPYTTQSMSSSTQVFTSAHTPTTIHGMESSVRAGPIVGPPNHEYFPDSVRTPTLPWILYSPVMPNYEALNVGQYQSNENSSLYHTRSPHWNLGFGGVMSNTSNEINFSSTLPATEPRVLQEDLFSSPYHANASHSLGGHQVSNRQEGEQVMRTRRRLPGSAPSNSPSVPTYTPVVSRVTRSSLTSPHFGPNDHAREVPTIRRAVERRGSRSRTSRRAVENSPSPIADDERALKDKFLIEKRKEGVPYKDIKILGNFPEAESTLRGRLRTLTRPKEARVRKPEWTELDVALLKEAVRCLSKGKDPDMIKISWTQVAKYILDHGGSYQFGNATCHKKWQELVAEGYQL